MLKRLPSLLLCLLAMSLCSFWGHTPDAADNSQAARLSGPTAANPTPPTSVSSRRTPLNGGRFLVYEGDDVVLIEADGARVVLGSLKDADVAKTPPRPAAAVLDPLQPPLPEKREARVVVTKRGLVFVPPHYLITRIGDDHVVAFDAIRRTVHVHYADGSVLKEPRP